MLGQPASWHTVCNPSRETSPRNWVYSGPILALTLIHGGLRSIGVSALRASIRSMRRPSGATVAGRAGCSVVGADCSIVTKPSVRRSAPVDERRATAVTPESL